VALNPLRPLALAVLHHGASVDARWESIGVKQGKHTRVYQLDFIARAPGRQDIRVPYMSASPVLQHPRYFRHLRDLREIAHPVARCLSDPLIALHVLTGEWP
jgi:hypothetical protein